MSRRLGPLFALVLGLLVCAAGAASASAATRYVATNGVDAPGGVQSKCLKAAEPCKTVQHAVEQAASTGDEISVGSGTFKGDANVNKALTIVGAGSGTVLESPSAEAAPLLAVTTTSLSVQNLKLRSGGTVPLVSVNEPSTSLTLSGVVAEGTSGGEPAIDAVGSGDTLTVENSTLSGRGKSVILAGGSGTSVTVTGSSVTAGPGGEFAIELQGGALRAEGSTVSGKVGVRAIEAQVDLEHDVVGASAFGIEQEEGSSVTIRDSLVAPTAGGTLQVGAFVRPLSGSAETLTVIGSTIFATTTSGHPDAIAIGSGGTATVNVANSILDSGPGAIDFVNEGSAVNVSISHTAYTTSGGTGVPEQGTGTNIAVAPAFANQPAGDYHLTEADQALIDAGDPSVLTPGETDLAGTARTTVGKCGGSPVPDLGAYEFVLTAACPPPSTGGGSTGGSSGGSSGSTGGSTGGGSKGGSTGGGGKPKLTGISVRKSKAGPVLHFTLNEAAKVKITVDRVVARRVHGHIKKALKTVGTLTDVAKAGGAQSVPLAAKIGASKLTPGAYRLILSATAGGARSALYSAGFSVAAAHRKPAH